LYRAEFRSSWYLQPQSPLAVYLSNEPYSSALVRQTRPPRINKKESDTGATTEQVQLGAGGGRLGFSVIKNQKKLLEVVDIDTTGLAYTSGLRPGDQIKRVNGEYARHARDLMGKILDKLDTDGVYMIVVRDEEETGILLVPPVEEYQPIEEF
jgi:C-terminal processing protease CtpA/Prc